MTVKNMAIDNVMLDEMIEDLRYLAFAQYFEKGDEDFKRYDKDSIMERIYENLTALIERALCFQYHETHKTAIKLALDFLNGIPGIIQQLHSDVMAAFENDPSASSYAEVVITCPGLYAISIQRFAHYLYDLKVPILPRLMTEIAHSGTGIDIHPGAVIGDGFYINHGTGTVIGETTVIGNNVSIYHGVTLGALTTQKNRQMKGIKRHPSIGNDVTIFPRATVLGGETNIGDGSVLKYGILVTKSVPKNSVLNK